MAIVRFPQSRFFKLKYLLITDSFSPKINSGAVINGDLVSELLRVGNQVLVVTFQDDLNKSYDYEITALYLVVGVNYSTEVLSIQKGQNEKAPMTAEINFLLKPDIRIFEMPVHTATLRVVEPPPLPPIVNFRNSKFFGSSRV